MVFNFGCLQFWFSFGQYIMGDNPISSLWQAMPFVGEKNAYAWEVYIISKLCLSSFKYFSTHGKNVCEQLTVYGVGGSFFSVLWNYFINKRNIFLLL